MNADADMLAAMREIAADMIAATRELTGATRALCAAVERQTNGRRRLSATDRGAAELLFPVIADAIRGRAFSFTYRDLVAHAAMNVAPAVALREALAGTDARRLGRLFRRCVDHDIAGYVITEVERTRTGVRWAISCGDRSPHVIASFARRVRLGSNL